MIVYQTTGWTTKQQNCVCRNICYRDTQTKTMQSDFHLGFKFHVVLINRIRLRKNKFISFIRSNIKNTSNRRRAKVIWGHLMSISVNVQSLDSLTWCLNTVSNYQNKNSRLHQEQTNNNKKQYQWTEYPEHTKQHKTAKVFLFSMLCMCYTCKLISMQLFKQYNIIYYLINIDIRW